MWSVADAIDDMIVVSLMGEQWSPKMPPDNAAAKNGAIGRPSPAAAGTAMGSMIANVPQLVPVAKAMAPDVTNTSGARSRASSRVSPGRR